jgi:hypothetical protein
MRYMILLLSVFAPMLAFGDSHEASTEEIRAIVRELAAATRSGDAATWDRYRRRTSSSRTLSAKYITQSRLPRAFELAR